MRKITAIVILSLLPSLTIPAQETKEISKSSNSSSTEEYTNSVLEDTVKWSLILKIMASTVSMEETMVIQRKTGIPFNSPFRFSF